MTTRSNIEQKLDLYLADGAEQAPDRVIDAALRRIDHTSQRHALRLRWRSNLLPVYLKSVMAGAAVIAVLAVGGVLLTGGPSAGGGPPMTSPSPSESPSLSPSRSIDPTDTSDWVPFTSQRYGYEIKHPPTWVASQATGDWDFDTSRLDFRTADADSFLSGAARFTAFASDVPADTSEDEWIATYYGGSVVDGIQCEDFLDLQEISVDGRPGRLGVNGRCADAQAFVFIDRRVHVFAIWRENQEALLEAFLSTVEFQP